MKLFSVYDKTAKTYGVPFFQRATEQALRAFKMEVNRPHDQNVIFHTPEDFSLYLVGTFDQDTGAVTGCDPELIAQASTLMQEK